MPLAIDAIDEITMKLKRRAFSAIFVLTCIAALELEQVVLEETPTATEARPPK
jgi:hypothetical protein